MPADFCRNFEGEARGVCRALIATCEPGGQTPPACQDLTERFLALTGRRYVAYSVEECALIRFVCPAGEVPFFDATGCGCEIAP